MFQRRRQQNFGVYLLAYQLLNSGFIPPVTLLLIVFQIAVFLEIVPVFASLTLGKFYFSFLSCCLPKISFNVNNLSGKFTKQDFKIDWFVSYRRTSLPFSSSEVNQRWCLLEGKRKDIYSYNFC